MSAPQITEVDIPEAGDTAGIGQALRDYFARVRGGDVGSLPAVLGLIVLVALFSILQSSTFFTALNFANLLNQGTAIIVLAMGLVFVLPSVRSIFQLGLPPGPQPRSWRSRSQRWASSGPWHWVPASSPVRSSDSSSACSLRAWASHRSS